MIKNIIIVNDTAFIDGGAAKVALTSAIELSKQGYNIILFSGKGPISSDLLESGIKVICLNQQDILNDTNRIRAIFQGLWNRKAYKRFKLLLSEYSPQDTIIHFHSWSKVLSSALFRITAKYNYKILVTLHEYFLICPNGGLFNYKKQEICNIKASSVKCLTCNCDSRSYYHKLWRFLRGKIQKYNFKLNKNISIISISKLNRKITEPYLKQYVANWYHLQNPIELNQKESVPIEKNQEYLFLGRLSAEKGINLFCQAITELGLKGYVLGDGYMRNAYSKKYPNIHFPGWVTGNEKDKLIRRSKALIFPSLWYEGAPLTITEIKSYGIPCIVPDLCSASEEVEHEKDGLIFKSGNLESLKEAITKYENSPITEFQNRIKETFDYQKYTIESHCKELQSIYNKIL